MTETKTLDILHDKYGSKPAEKADVILLQEVRADIATKVAEEWVSRRSGNWLPISVCAGIA